MPRYKLASYRAADPRQSSRPEIDRVMHAVAALGADADPTEVKKLFAMLKPGTPDELEYVTIEDAP